LTLKYNRKQARGWKLYRGGAASGFLPATAILNADRDILLVEDEVLEMPAVQEQCAHLQVIAFVSRGYHYVNYYRMKRQCTAALANTRDPADTQ
jgi:hypothetical protein